MSLYEWLLLKSIKDLGNKSIKKLFVHFKSAKAILEADLPSLEEIVGKAKAQNIKLRNSSFKPELVIKLLEKENVKALTLEDKDYPKKLLDIEDPPPVIFVLGHLKNTPLMGVVGTRKPHQYSIEFTKDLVKNIVEAGYGVVSGGARGIDFTAHYACVSHGGYTVCILGMGIKFIPPYLRDTILKSGAFLSEFLPNESPEKYNFPVRNRLISALSQCVFVVEAGENSGALITAEYAYTQGIPVRVHVGYGKSERWRGCVNLLNEGKAKFIMKPEEIKNQYKTVSKSDDPILNLLVTPRDLDEIMSLTGMSFEEALMKLTNYEMEGLVQKVGNRYFRKI